MNALQIFTGESNGESIHPGGSVGASSSKNTSTKTSAFTRKHDMAGCHVCKKDDDHAKLLLCEICNDEYHIYCLDPPLKAVPEGDFYCGTNMMSSSSNAIKT